MNRNIFFGEVVNSYAPGEEQNLNGLRYEYDVRCFVNGSALIFPNAILIEPVSGIDNYHEVVLRSSTDDEGAGFELHSESALATFRSGDRVLVCFPNDSPTSPVIIGTLPHPAVSALINGTSDSDPVASLPALSDTVRPQLRGRYNGFQYRVDETGQTRLQHTGAAEIKIEQGNFSQKIDEPVTSQTTLDFLSKGSWRLVDNNEQAIVIDAEKKFISINNTTVAPDETFQDIGPIEIGEPNDDEAPIGQEVRLDQANETLSVLTSKQYKLIVGQDSLEKIFGSVDETVFGDHIREVGGDFIETIGGQVEMSVAGGYLKVDVKTSVEYVSQTGSSIKMDGSGNIEAVASDGSTIKMGPSGVIEIQSSSEVNVTAAKVNILGDEVDVGASANFKAVLGDVFETWANAHTHPTAVGPSGPPITPLPPSALSETVKIQG